MVQSQPAFTPVEAVERALAVWRRENGAGRMTDYTLRTYALVVERWAKFVTAHGITDIDAVPEPVLVDFINASGITRHGVVTPASVSSRHVRRATLRHLYATLRDLGIAHGDPARDVPLPPRTPLATRALTDDEADMVRYYSRASEAPGPPPSSASRCPGWRPGRRPHTQSSGRGQSVCRKRARPGRPPGSEILICERRDVDLDLGRVWARGGAQRDARWCLISGWEAEAVLQRAGLAGEPDIKPSSVTYYAAARVFANTGRIEAAARAIGFTSLDSAALAVGFDWRQTGGAV